LLAWICTVIALTTAVPQYATAQESTPDWLTPELVGTGLTLPSIPEVFRAVAKESNPRWRQFYRTARPPRGSGDRQHSAFGLGVQLCEALLAAEARDSQQLRNTMQDIRDSFTFLGLADRLDARQPAIFAFAEDQNWGALRLEFDALALEVAEALGRQSDADLAFLLKQGIWMRCLEICAEVSVISGKPTGIGDAEIYGSIVSAINELPAETARQPVFKDLKAETERLRRRWAESQDTLPASIEATREKVTNLIDRILQPPHEKG